MGYHYHSVDSFDSILLNTIPRLGSICILSYFHWCGLFPLHSWFYLHFHLFYSILPFYHSLLPFHFHSSILDHSHSTCWSLMIPDHSFRGLHFWFIHSPFHSLSMGAGLIHSPFCPLGHLFHSTTIRVSIRYTILYSDDPFDRVFICPRWLAMHSTFIQLYDSYHSIPFHSVPVIPFCVDIPSSFILLMLFLRWSDSLPFDSHISIIHFVMTCWFHSIYHHCSFQIHSHHYHSTFPFIHLLFIPFF